jgi:uncharacterized phage-like protein YoqJ
MKIMITGHRKLSDSGKVWLEKKLDWFIPRVLKKYNPIFLSGMALGADTIFVEKIVEYEGSFEAYIPGPWQANKWPEEDRVKYERLLLLAKDTHVPEDVSETYNAKHFFDRNGAMVRDADNAIAVWNSKESGGTYDAVKKIQKKGIIWWHINPEHETAIWK